jgi:osmoprotectant transport system ATP-binding protein
MNVVEIQSVQVRYPGGVHALRGVDLEVHAGETVALVGESGSGKSTLLQCVNRMVRPDSGDVRFEGAAVGTFDADQLRRRIGYVQQNGGLLPHWTVRQNVGLVPRLLGWARSRIDARCTELLDLVGLPSTDYAERHPRALSGGQRQRVAFARALAAEPKLLLLDEPFGALDPLRRRELQEEFVRWKAELRPTTLLVTHDLDEALRLADRIAVMLEGEILQVADGMSLRSRPAHGYVERLLRTVSS